MPNFTLVNNQNTNDGDVKTIGKHINNALKEELEGLPVVAKFATTKKYGRVEGFTLINKENK